MWLLNLGRIWISTPLPSYSYMRPGSKTVSVALGNLSEKVQTFKKGTVIASVKAANLVPPK